jgi:hypothetical protein
MVERITPARDEGACLSPGALQRLPENLERSETAVAASLVIAISVVVITLVLTLGSGIGL